MQDWTGGYVTDIEYTSGFYRELAPASMNFAALLRGYAAPVATQAYNWLEIGCGNGLSANALAAANPQSSFHAFDFNPVHIQNAQRVARDAKLANVHFYEDSFEQALHRDLPAMDYIVLHGIYSWVNAENRAHIVNLIRKFLKPGGVVYISYNCLPGWSSKAPLRRLMTEYAARRGGPVLERVAAARSFVHSMKEAGVRYYAANPAAVALADSLQTQDVNYLAHEYMNADWDLFYHSDVVKDLSAAKLTYAASATAIENLNEASLTPSVAKLVEAEADPVLKELLRDFGMNQQFRRDLFIRGARRMATAEFAKVAGAIKLCLSRSRDECKRTVNLPVGEVTLAAKIYDPILDALMAGPKTLKELSEQCDLPFQACLQAATILTSLNYLQLMQAPVEGALQSCMAFNVAALNRAVAGEELSVLAAASLGTAVGVSATDQYMLHAYLSKAEDPAAHLLKILKTLNRHLIHEGKVVEGDEATLAQLRESYAKFSSKVLPFYLICGIIH
ncbi:hypothetical protein ASD15_26910 [Massilia sp. Root351]|jgi:SAM-dependent methyltransferase|uniref:class I SAM-dependent methyltransferase n=1 Tax=Massilia sp. Root351 TaxID=1736522 RepID=UPI00070B0D4E|nr:class I SAM-dependent methyltransferase [Massilia sp. Root351]KQV88710.1 hypothetical protein ASD15_26910 [Massilia sp. Root351]